MELMFQNPKPLDMFTMTGGAKIPVGVRDAVHKALANGLIPVIVVYGWEVQEGEIQEVMRSHEQGSQTVS